MVGYRREVIIWTRWGILAFLFIGLGVGLGFGLKALLGFGASTGAVSGVFVGIGLLVAAAGLYVFPNEPSVPDELEAMLNGVLLPHIGSASVVTRNAMDQLVVYNIMNCIAARAPLTPVP